MKSSFLLLSVLIGALFAGCSEPARTSKLPERTKEVAGELLQARRGDFVMIDGYPVPIVSVSPDNTMFFIGNGIVGPGEGPISWVASLSDEVILHASEKERWIQVAEQFFGIAAPSGRNDGQEASQQTTH